MNLRRTLTIAATLLAVIAAGALPKNNILTLKNTITDNDIVFPESFETDTRELMQNWYLQNYTVLDADVENRSAGEVSEDEYIKRLAAIPSVIELPYNQIVRSYIDRYVVRNRTLVEEMLGMSLYYMPIFEQALEKEGLPLELKYLPVIESSLNPNAVSRAGAAGLWQFMVGTGKGLGLEVNSLVDERRDPYRSSEKAATYLKNLYTIYNDWSLAIAAYNCGPANVNKALRRAGGENRDFWEIYPYLPRETRGYVPAFIAANYVMTYFKRHNISPAMARKPLLIDTVSVNRRVHFDQISHVLNIPVEELRVLNPQYRRDVVPASDDRSYTIALPSQQVYAYIMSEDSILAYQPQRYTPRPTVEPSGVSESQDNGNYTYETRTVTAYHKVARGETATSIAAKYGMTTQQLLSMNNVRGGKVQRGKVLKVQTRKRVRVAKEAESGDLAMNSNSDESEDSVNSGDSNDSDDSEEEQIDEVKRVEQAAKDAPRRGPQKVDIPVEPTRAEPAPQPANSKQWRQRNAQYTDNARHSRHRSQEENYRHSRSNNRRGDAGRRSKQKVAQQAPTEYTIKKGESLSEISEKTGISVKELKQANNISGDKIKAGDNLKLPQKGAKTAKGKSGKGANASKATGKSKSSGKSAGKRSRRRR